MVARTTRRVAALLVLLLLGGGLWLSGHPDVLSRYLSRFARRNLLHGTGGDLRIRHWGGSIWRGAVLRGVLLDLPARDGRPAVTAEIDTLILSFRLRELLHPPVHLQRVAVRGARVFVRDAPAGATGKRSAHGVAPPRLTVGELVLSRIALQRADTAGRLTERIERLDWSGTVRSDTAVVLVCRQADVEWPSRESRLSDLRGRIVLGPSGLRIDPLYGRLNDHPFRLRLTRSPAGRLDLTATGEGIGTDEVTSLTGVVLDVPARGDATVTLRGSADTLSLDLAFTGELPPYRLDGLRARGRLVPGRLTWERLTGVINGARFAGQGVVDLARPDRVTLHLQGEATDIDLSRGLVPDVPDLPRTGGAGRLDLLLHPGYPDSRIRAWLTDGFIDAVPFDSLAAAVDVDSTGVHFRRLDLTYGPAVAFLVGDVDTREVFRGRLRVTTPDLGRLPAAWGLPPLRGAALVAGDVTGRADRYDFAGRAVLHGAGVGPVAADTCRLELSVTDALGAPHVRCAGKGAGFRLGGMPLGRFVLVGSVTPELVYLDRFTTQQGDTTVSLRCQVALRDSGAVYYVPELDVDMAGTRWRLERAARLHTAPGVVAVRDLALVSPGGRLAVSGRWDEPRGMVRGSWDLQRLDLDLLNPFLPAAGGYLNGEVSAAGEVEGTPDHPRFSLRASLVDADYPLASIDSLGVVLGYDDGVVAVDTLDLRSDYGRVVVTGRVAHAGTGLADFWPGAALDLDLAFQDGDWAFLEQFAIPALDRLAGTFSGRVHLAGTTLAPRLGGDLYSAPFHVHWLHLDELSGRVDYEDGILTLADLAGRKGTLPMQGRIEVPLELDLLHEPVSPVDGPLFMHFVIPEGSDLTDLAGATNAFALTGGRGGLDLRISGPADHPLFDGWARVTQGECVLRDMSEKYRDVVLEGTWHGDRLTVTRLEAAEGKRGWLRGTGYLDFLGLKMTGFHFGVRGDRYLFATVPDLRALLRTDALAIDGVPVGPDSILVPRFSGPVEVLEARYTGDFEEKEGVTDIRQATVEPEWLADLEIHAEPHAIAVVNSTMELHLGGDVRLIRDQDGLELRGELIVNQGHLPVFNNDFKVREGRVDFSSGTGVFPVLDITAETSVRLPAPDGGSRRLERITVRVTGNALHPQVSFSSESGYPRASIERMLLGLSPHATDTQTTSVLETQALAAGFNLLERDIARELDVVDTVDIESGRVRVDGTTQTLIGVGKYIGRDLYVKFSQALADPDREVLIEYQITDHLSLQSEIQRRQDEGLGNTTYSLDLKYRFEY